MGEQTLNFSSKRLGFNVGIAPSKAITLAVIPVLHIWPTCPLTGFGYFSAATQNSGPYGTGTVA